MEQKVLKNIVIGDHDPQFDCDCKKCDVFWDALEGLECTDLCTEKDEDLERELDIVFEQDGW